jgi:1-acyl-sn-glycerol-3-phosphate acyltransferase
MENKVLVFKPKAKAYFKSSSLYALPMFLKSLGLASRYVMRSVNKKLSVQETDKYVDMFWRTHFQETFTSLYVTGRELLTPGEAYVFMSNHESWMDIPAMFGAVPTSLRMVSKEGLMKIPIFGHAMVNAGFVAIDRRNKTRAIRQLDHAKDRLREGISIWIAPEGTRTRNGTIGPFKKGGFYLAKDLKKSIAPVFIEGAARVMAADGLTVNTNLSITVHFCKPVHFDEFEHCTIPQILDLVRQAIIDKQTEVLKLGS